MIVLTGFEDQGGMWIWISYVSNKVVSKSYLWFHNFHLLLKRCEFLFDSWFMTIESQGAEYYFLLRPKILMFL